MISADFGYDRACEYIKASAPLGSRPGLERIKDLCALLGDPQDRLRIIHVAGTNGKGSTACMIASVLSAAGLNTGMYYSPALTGIRDHYRINGELISEEDYALCVAAVADANEKLKKETGESATQFELETALAFVWFAEKKCDIVILECGMGGTYDATNIVKNKLCCVITSVSFDHMQYLGRTLAEIAAHKAGVITSNCPVIAFSDPKEVISVMEEKCRRTGSRLYTVARGSIECVNDFPVGQKISYEEFSDVTISLAGTFQAENAALALRAISVLNEDHLIEGVSIDEDAVRSGLRNVYWPFRFECISVDPLVFVDGAHNADAAVKLWQTADTYLEGYKIILVLGIYADKEYEKVTSILAGLAETVFTVATPNDKRALPADKLAECARRYCNDVISCDSIEEAYTRSRACITSGERACIIACGSLAYLNEFCNIVRG
ncbi:MAG: bifunctional folylpolyglutamate synthase/dihydrofolate synthase [Lachnospiraceae bacterium]|nr:bifunctional folylpolyglutamate synthase/dihydrofolate synthase [Lachnospiraceae bacterium]